ncbi:MAG: DUF523 domain-containing protein [Candidatus Electrothrix sp. YB6]
MKQCLVSSCLTGLCTRYDGRSKPDARCQQYLNDFHYIPVCPEQLGGLPTPRIAAELTGGDGTDVLHGRAKVITLDDRDVSRQFIAGAEAVLKIARDQHIELALLKAGSPSCGVTQLGVTAALLLACGIRVIEF